MIELKKKQTAATWEPKSLTGVVERVNVELLLCVLLF